jgi:hypothetical protein
LRIFEKREKRREKKILKLFKTKVITNAVFMQYVCRKFE